MFYGVEILSRKGKLGIIWLAATYGKKHLTNRQCRSVNIPKACNAIINPPTEFSLRLSATLTLGVVRIYNEQTRCIYGDARNIKELIKLTFKPQGNIDHPHDQARRETITLPDPAVLPITNEWPELLRLLQIEESGSSSTFEDINGTSSVSHSPVSAASRKRKSPTTAYQESPPAGPNQASPGDISLPSDEDVDKIGIIEDVPPFMNDFEAAYHVPPEDLPDVKMMEQDQGISPVRDGKLIEDVGPGDDTEVMLINPDTGQLEIASPVTETDIKPTLRPLEQTPRDRLRPTVDQDAPPRPAKRRRRRTPRGPLVDSITQLQARRNLQFDAETRRPQLCEPPAPTARVLLRTPAKKENGSSLFLHMWQRNAFFLEDIPLSSYEDEDEIEQRRLRESGISEQSSALSRLSVDSVLKVDDTGNKSDLDDIAMPEAVGEIDDFGQGSPTGLVSPIPELSPVPEEQELDTDISGFVKESSESEGIGSDIKAFLQKIREAMGRRSQVSFHKVVPLTTSRREAAFLFYHALALVKNEVIVMEQDEPFGQITIFIGPNW